MLIVCNASAPSRLTGLASPLVASARPVQLPTSELRPVKHPVGRHLQREVERPALHPRRKRNASRRGCSPARPAEPSHPPQLVGTAHERRRFVHERAEPGRVTSPHRCHLVAVGHLLQPNSRIVSSMRYRRPPWREWSLAATTCRRATSAARRRSPLVTRHRCTPQSLRRGRCRPRTLRAVRRATAPAANAYPNSTRRRHAMSGVVASQCDFHRSTIGTGRTAG